MTLREPQVSATWPGTNFKKERPDFMWNLVKISSKEHTFSMACVADKAKTLFPCKDPSCHIRWIQVPCGSHVVTTEIKLKLKKLRWNLVYILAKKYVCLVCSPRICKITLFSMSWHLFQIQGPGHNLAKSSNIGTG